MAPGSATGAHTYAYDPAHRLTEASYPNGRFEHFAYDAVGNRLALEDHTGAKTEIPAYPVEKEKATSGMALGSAARVQMLNASPLHR